jgi:hypothetical protein
VTEPREDRDPPKAPPARASAAEVLGSLVALTPRERVWLAGILSLFLLGLAARTVKLRRERAEFLRAADDEPPPRTLPLLPP